MMASSVVADLKNVLQGTQSQLFEASDEFSSPCTTSVFELGRLHRLTLEVMNEHASGLCPVMDALFASVHAELESFVRSLARLDSELRTDDKSDALRYTSSWAEEKLPMMRASLSLLQSTAGMSGTAICNVCYGLSQHGDARIASPTSRALHASLRPVLAAATCWMLTGSLQGSSKKGTSDVFWVMPSELPSAQSSATVRVSAGHVPACIPLALAAQVAAAGAAAHFLRYACADAHWLKQLVSEYSSPETAPGSPAVQASQLPEVARLGQLAHNVQPCLDARVRHMLCVVHGLQMHVRALRRYVLLGQGDFASSLVSSVAQTGLADMPLAAAVARKPSLASALEAATRASNAHLDNKDVLDRLELCLQPIHAPSLATSPCWRALQVRYAVQQPLSAVLTEESLASYGKIFTLLWHCKQAEHVLSSLWSSHMTSFHALHALGHEGLSALLHACHMTRGDMTHTVSALLAFFQCDVLSPAFSTLETRLTEARGVTSLLSAHDQYMQECMHGCFLRQEGREAYSCIMTVLDSIHTFCQLQDDLYHGMDALRPAPVRAEDRGKCRAPVARREPLTPDEIVHLDAVTVPMKAPLQQAAQHYHNHVRYLLSLVERSGAGMVANGLATRLHFSTVIVR